MMQISCKCCPGLRGHLFVEVAWVSPVAGAGRAGVDVSVSAGLGLIGGFCCLGDMFGLD